MRVMANHGKSFPLGASVSARGANFSLFSRHATNVELVFFDRKDDIQPSRVVPVDPKTNRTYHYWHVFVPGIQAGQLYGYRVHGPSDRTTKSVGLTGLIWKNMPTYIDLSVCCAPTA